MTAVDVGLDDRGCRLITGRAAPLTLSTGWLQRHDEGPDGLDPRTGQRRIVQFDDGVTANGVEVTAGRLVVSWSDGRHTRYSLSTLTAVAADARRPPGSAAPPDPRVGGGRRRLWSRPVDDLEPLDVGDAGGEQSWCAELLGRLDRLGWAVIDGVPPGVDGVSALVGPLGYVRRTVFGEVWELEDGLVDHADSAYDNTFLGPHTDGTYSHDAPGLQVFVCQERSGSGGASLLVDGFAAAAALTARSPGGAGLLAAVDVPCRYVEPGVSLRAERPVLRVDHAGRLVQVSYNPYDRAPFAFTDPDAWDRFDSAYRELGSILDDRDRWQMVEWRPRRALVLDNWRVLHGRETFDGTRRFLGAYTNHEDFESALRLAEPAG